MRGLFFAASCLFAFVLGDELEKVKKILDDCRAGDVEQCKQVQAKNRGFADNAYCSSFDVNKYDFDTHWKPICAVSKTCDTKEADDGFSYHQNGQLTHVEVDDIIDSFTGDLRARIGTGIRRHLMDPSFAGPHACRSWIQLRDDEGTHSYWADAFSYHQREIDGKMIHMCKFWGKIPDALRQAARVAAKNSIIWGNRYCGCDYPLLKLECKPLAKDDAIVKACKEDPTAEECMKVDSITLAASADACMVGADVKDTCFKSDKLPSTCYHTGGVPQSSGPEIVVSNAVSVRDMLVKAGQGSFYEFASHVGFDEYDPEVKHLTYRTKTLIPELAGPVACRNLLNLRGSLGRYAFGQDYFAYDPDTKSCRFFWGTEKRLLQELIGAEDAIAFGDKYCL